MKILFKDFKRKMWMTVSLGVIFFFLYLIIVLVASYLIPHWGINLFLVAQHNPVQYIYGGLWVFAALTLTIYFARMFIKYIYLTRGKDN